MTSQDFENLNIIPPMSDNRSSPTAKLEEKPVLPPIRNIFTEKKLGGSLQVVGPRYDEKGKILNRSIVGNPEIFEKKLKLCISLNKNKNDYFFVLKKSFLTFIALV